MLNNKNYITVQGWMIKELNLKGNELLAYALIYGFSQDNESVFSGTNTYVADWLNTTKKTAINVLKDLVQKEYIIKIEKKVNGVKFYDYKINTQVVKNFQGGSEKITPHNNIYNNIPPLNNNNKLLLLSPQGEQLREHFKDLWNNKLIVFYKQCYPHNVQLQKITRASLKHLPARDKELKSLVKELIADGVITAEDVGDDVWRWAFTQIWERIQRSSFLRGTARGYEGFVPNAEFILEPSKFIKIVTPIAISKYGLDDKR